MLRCYHGVILIMDTELSICFQGKYDRKTSSITLFIFIPQQRLFWAIFSWLHLQFILSYFFNMRILYTRRLIGWFFYIPFLHKLIQRGLAFISYGKLESSLIKVTLRMTFLSRQSSCVVIVPSQLANQMLSSHRLICNGDDWCISVLDILSDFLATSDLAIFDIQLYVFWESPKQDLKERALKN